MFRGSMKSTGYPLHSPVSPSLPLPCVTVCHHISNTVYYVHYNYYCSYDLSHTSLFHGCTPIIFPGLLIVEVSRYNTDTPHFVRLLWTSDHPVAETSTWQLTTLITNIHDAGGIRIFHGCTPIIVLGPFIVDVSRYNTDTPYFVGLLWTSEYPVANTCTWQLTILITDKHPQRRRDSNPQSHKASGLRHTL